MTNPSWQSRLVAVVLVASLYAAAQPRNADAVESIVLVVNRNSWTSRTIANYYIQLRQIPDRNVVLLDYRDSPDRLSIDEFRRQILEPVWKEIDRRKLTPQIDYIVYSADFPYRIDYSQRVPPGTEFPFASLTGLTYFGDQVFGTGAKFAEWNASATGNPNEYAVATWREESSLGIQKFRTELQRGSARRSYRLSAMLGYTAGRGNSVAEVISYLRRAAIADSSHPGGTFYFISNSDIRSEARASAFPSVVQALQSAGFQAEIFKGTVPPPQSDVIGAMLGSETFQWNETSRILPGAICENFTSFGGVLHENGTQTPLSELLRLGAAGSSGTVAEPRAIPPKFPHPMMHIHYARGCTLAESYYQAVLSPYQLLIVGDPWCTPWAIRPQVDLEGVTEGEAYSGQVAITPRVAIPGSPPINDVSLYLDGYPIGKVKPGQAFPLDTTRFADGFHQITAVAQADTVIGTTGRRHVHVTFNNRGQSVRLVVDGSQQGVWGRTWRIRAESQGCKRLALLSQGETLARLDAPEGDFTIRLDSLGIGPIRLEALGFAEASDQGVRSVPYQVDVQPPPLIRSGPRTALGAAQPGILVQRSDGTRQIVTDAKVPDWPEKAGVPANGEFLVRGIVEAPIADLYQFRGTWTGTGKLTWNGEVQFSGDAAQLRYGIPLHLSAGVYSFSCDVRLKGSPRAELQFGNRGASQLDARNSRTLP